MSSDDSIIKSQSIDVVITWVDGNDPAHKAKVAKYLTNVGENQFEDIAGAERFANVGEIYFCVASILRFASFVRKIFIVTDSQNPNLDEFVSRNFPNNKTPIEIVDHMVLFHGYEQCLPVFNSLSLETMLYRIPGLSENFVYFNDDFFLVNRVKPEDWFVNGVPVAYGHWYSIPFAKFLRWIKPKKHGHKTFGFKDSMLNGALAINEKRKMFCILHTPQALKKSILEEIYSRIPEKLEANIRFHFRDPKQFNPQSMFYTYLGKQNKCIIRGSGYDLYMKPSPRKGSDYILRKLQHFDNSPTALFCCINSFLSVSADDKKAIIDWVERKLKVNFGE